MLESILNFICIMCIGAVPGIFYGYGQGFEQGARIKRQKNES